MLFILFQGGDKYQEAYYIYEEIAQSPSSNTVKILNGQAIANIHLGRYPEAESLLLDALNKVCQHGMTRGRQRSVIKFCRRYFLLHLLR